jgi:formate dehydrogenase major subunit
VIVVIGANPTDAHPVFASRMKRRLRAGARLIVDRPARHRPGAHPHVEAAHSTCSCGRAPTSRSSTRWRT